MDPVIRSRDRLKPGADACVFGILAPFAVTMHYGIGELTAVTILAELGDCTRFSSSRQAVRYAGAGHHRLPVRSASRARAHLASGVAGVALGAVRGRAGRPPWRARLPDRAYYLRGRGADRRQPRVPVGRAQAAQALLTHAARARRGGAWLRHEPSPVRATALAHTDAPRPAPGRLLPPRSRGRPRKTERPQRFPQRDHPINHHVADPEPTRVVDRSKAGRPRAQHDLSHRSRARTSHPTAVQP